ncbi:RagB/SusD family nutrient uptake outer membrane protein [Belliella marina]|uniref:RagB/SusD family nutrient uptake outer membrane protein n=1 Tax=Belliella marina TaxID=1644146 RepID=A0ABW4VQV6_9BACT
MKKISIKYIVLFATMVFASCHGLLDEENKSNVVADEFFTTEEGFESLVNAVYSNLRPVHRDPWVYNAGTDMYVEGRNAQPEGISEYRNLTPFTGEVNTFYTNVYRAIQHSNTALYYGELVPEFSSLNTRVGEVKFLRAYYYFLLVQQFGGVAIVTDRINSPQTEFTRNSEEEVYAFIIGEMNEALALVPEVAAEFGRVSKRAVRHFLAKVHLTRGYLDIAASNDFELASSLADAAIAGQGLTLSFEDLFWPGNEENAEILFSIQYDLASMPNLTNSGNIQNYFFGPYMGGQGAAEGYPNRSYTLCPTMYTFDLFTEHDARFNTTFMIEYYNRYYDYYDRKDERDELKVKYYYTPKWDLADTTAWRQADPANRADTKIIPYSNVWEASRSTPLDNATPAVRKFDDPNAVFSGAGSSSRDMFLARLGETYLIAAEAYFQRGDLATAADRINTVRARAAKTGSQAQMQISAADVNIDFILDERGRELLGEYHRWTDLKRTGQLIERTRLYNRDIKQKWFDNGVNPFEGIGGGLKILRPIPQAALDLNDSEYPQNPGY